MPQMLVLSVPTTMNEAEEQACLQPAFGVGGSCGMSVPPLENAFQWWQAAAAAAAAAVLPLLWLRLPQQLPLRRRLWLPRVHHRYPVHHRHMLVVGVVLTWRIIHRTGGGAPLPHRKRVIYRM